MLLPISWLKQFVDIKATPEQIAEKLTLSGSEVERIIRPDAGLSRIVVGEIKEIKPHPQADKLQLAFVAAGKKDLLQIVCGASNIKVGQKVPAVLAGGAVPGAKIEPREIRGVASEGMLASGRELGISDDRSGIFILPDEAKAGEDAVKLLQLDEPVLELAITPNRADCFSVIGLAREAAALFNLRLTTYNLRLKESGKKASSVLSVEIKDKNLCPKYAARVIENVTVAPSPLWLANRLRQVGVKSINNIVDITNFVMMETGQPLHAFDANAVGSNVIPAKAGIHNIIIRRAKPGEKILALDGNNYDLDESMLVIANDKRPIAIAGIMGGQDSGVADNTRNVILEAAGFDAVSVRRTARALGLRSESSARFEKGVDLSAIEAAAARAAQLISNLAGGAILKGIISVSGSTHGFVGTEQRSVRIIQSIKISTKDITRLLGVAIKEAKIKSILQSLGFTVSGSSSALTVKVPSWRGDVSGPADLAEEIGRMIDYNTLPKTLPSGAAQSPVPEKSYELRRHLRQHLAAAGFSEILTYSFYDEKLLGLSGVAARNHIIVTNPVNKEYKYLRASLLPGLLAKLSQNSALLAREQFRLFEIGKIFDKKPGERWQAVVGLIDVKATHEQLYRRLRGISEAFINCPIEVSRDGDGYVLSAAGRSVARVVIKNKEDLPLRLRAALAVMTVDLDALEKVWRVAPVKFAPLPIFPAVERDLAMIVPDKVQYKEIKAATADFNPLLKKVELFDVYHGLSAGAGLAFRLSFSALDRTLDSREVDDVIESLKQNLIKKYKINFR